MNRVAILTYEQAALFELGCAVELFCLPRPEFYTWYDADVVSFADGPLSTTAGIRLSAKTVNSLSVYSTLIIPSWPTEDAQISKGLTDSIRQFVTEGKRVISFCSGAFLLARLGILDGRVATTHWRYEALFKKQFPNVRYVDDVLYVYDGVVGCSAGSTAAIDLGIEVIRDDFGHDVANKVARRLVMPAHRKGGQSQYVETPLPKLQGQFSEALDWALGHLHLKIDINFFAKKANMTRRTFDRKFRAHLNQTPKEWITQQRLNLAKTLLEKPSYQIEQVADLAGFENATTMRHHFRKCLGISPQQYREQFSSKES